MIRITLSANESLAPKRRKKDIERLEAELAALEREETQSIRDLEEARQKQRLQKAHRDVSLVLTSNLNSILITKSSAQGLRNMRHWNAVSMN